MSYTLRDLRIDVLSQSISQAFRLTAAERRDELVAAASIEFSANGYAGTPTAAIARRAGVSQPYLFQLFRTKKDLFIAPVRDCFDRTRLAFEVCAREAKEAGRSPKAILETMGHAYPFSSLVRADGRNALKPSSRPDQRSSVCSRPGSAKMATVARL